MNPVQLLSLHFYCLTGSLATRLKWLAPSPHHPKTCQCEPEAGTETSYKEKKINNVDDKKK